MRKFFSIFLVLFLSMAPVTYAAEALTPPTIKTFKSLMGVEFTIDSRMTIPGIVSSYVIAFKKSPQFQQIWKLIAVGSALQDTLPINTSASPIRWTVILLKQDETGKMHINLNVPGLAKTQNGIAPTPALGTPTNNSASAG